MPQRAYLDAEPAPASGRSPSGRTLRLNAEGRTASGARLEVLIHEVTERALLLESALPLARGDKLDVVVPGVGAMQAEVVWTMGRFFACQFTERMPAAAACVLRPPGGAAEARPPDEEMSRAARQIEELSMAVLRLGRIVDRAIDQLLKESRSRR